MSRGLLACCVAAIAGCATGAPPRGIDEPAPRRAIAAVADTNDPQAYYDVGLRALETDLGLAVDAFYWASRLDPASPDALYARRIALHAYNFERVRGYLTSERYAPHSTLVRQIDSLQYLALLRNPFLFVQFDEQLISIASRRAARVGLRPPIYYSGDRQRAAWLAYSRGNFTEAVKLYAEAIERDTSDFWLHGARARAFYLLTQYDSALQEMTRMLERARAAEATRLTPMYQAKAAAEYAVALIHLAREDNESARDALERALAEDVAFYMAHAVLGDVHLALGDTTRALAEHELAVQLEGADPALRLRYGATLLNARRLDAALVEFQRAIELNPDFAQPYFFLAWTLERLGRRDEAIGPYLQFAERASRTLEPEIAAVTRRVAELRAGPSP